MLELSAFDDYEDFRGEVDEKGLDVNEVGLWYDRSWVKEDGIRNKDLFNDCFFVLEALRCSIIFFFRKEEVLM